MGNNGRKKREGNQRPSDGRVDRHSHPLFNAFVYIIIIAVVAVSCSSSCSSSSYSCWALLVIVWISEFVLCKNHYDIRLSKANNKRGSTTIVFLQGYAWFNRCPSLTEFSQLFIDTVWHAVKDSI